MPFVMAITVRLNLPQGGYILLFLVKAFFGYFSHAL